MAYTKLIWTDDDAPALSATNLNHIENGIADLYTLLANMDRSGVEILISFISKVKGRATAEGVTATEIVNRIPYSNTGLPSASSEAEGESYSTLNGDSAL